VSRLLLRRQGSGCGVNMCVCVCVCVCARARHMQATHSLRRQQAHRDVFVGCVSHRHTRARMSHSHSPRGV
jgi:hypothetical protein